MIAAIMAHLGFNAATVFWAYSSLGITATIGAVSIIGAMVSLVVLILWLVYPITNILVKALAKFLQKIPSKNDKLEWEVLNQSRSDLHLS